MNLFILSVSAEGFYTNRYGVSFSEQEYSFISNFYFDGYQNFMSIDDYNDFIDSDIMNGEITIVEKKLIDDNALSLYSLSHETNAKILKLATSCSTTCMVTSTLSWKNVPNVKSYDLIGAYASGTKIKYFKKALLSYGSNSTTSVEKNVTSTGVSSTFKLPDTKELMTIVQQFEVNKDGTIYVSYQHAKKSISLANSRKYSFSASGYGGVYNFSFDVSSYYDGMGGVKTQV